MKVFCHICEKVVTLQDNKLFSCGHQQPNLTSEQRVLKSKQVMEELIKNYLAFGYTKKQAIQFIAQSKPRT